MYNVRITDLDYENREYPFNEVNVLKISIASLQETKLIKIN